MTIASRAGSASRWLPAAAVALLAAAAGPAGCDRFDRSLQPGSYRATLATPVGELPFGLDVAKESERFVLYLVDDDTRLRVENVVVGDGLLHATLPGSGAALELRLTRRRLEGELALPGGNGAPLKLPLVAEFGKTHLFFEDPLTDNADVQGRWSVVVSHDGVEGTPAIAEFEQRFERVSGRITTRDAAGPMLAGEIHDGDLYLSRFDGDTAVLLRATVDARGALDGEIWSSESGAARLQAVRNPDAVL